MNHPRFRRQQPHPRARHQPRRPQCFPQPSPRQRSRHLPSLRPQSRPLRFPHRLALRPVWSCAGVLDAPRLQPGLDHLRQRQLLRQLPGAFASPVHAGLVHQPSRAEPRVRVHARHSLHSVWHLPGGRAASLRSVGAGRCAHVPEPVPGHDGRRDGDSRRRVHSRRRTLVHLDRSWLRDRNLLPRRVPRVRRQPLPLHEERRVRERSRLPCWRSDAASARVPGWHACADALCEQRLRSQLHAVIRLE